MENKTPATAATLMSVASSVAPPFFLLGLGWADRKGSRGYRRVPLSSNVPKVTVINNSPVLEGCPFSIQQGKW